ncbi:MAG TPA: hypothetical protein VH796_14450 [Nitrososphaeraceae archaeon]
MSTIIGFLVQKMMSGGGSGGIGGMLSGLTGGSQQGSDSVGGIGSILSSLGGLNKDHELVRHVQQNTGIQDPDQARQYTQQGVDILNEQSKNNPQGLQYLVDFWEVAVEVVNKVVLVVVVLAVLEICFGDMLGI